MPAPHRLVSTNPTDEETMAPREAAMPTGSIGPPSPPIMTTTPPTPSTPPTTARARGRRRSRSHAHSIIASADVDMSDEAMLEGSRDPAT